MELSIVILNYKMKGLVKNCLQAILESKIDFPYEIIVVDNASHDGIDKMMAEKFPQVKLIMSDVNTGMGGGNNVGIKAAQGKYIMVLNPDIFVFPGSIQKMVDFIRIRTDIGFLAPRLLNPDRSLQYTSYRWYKFFTPIYRRTFLKRFAFVRRELDRFLMTDWDHRDNREVDWIQGSCFIAPKAVFDKVGLFEESFFMYFEDTDLCRRIHQAGYKIFYFAGAEVIHLHLRQSGGGIISVLFNRLTRVHIISWVRYMWKWRGDKHV